MRKLCTISRRVEDVILALDEEPRSRLRLMADLEIGAGTLDKILKNLEKAGILEEVPVSRARNEYRLTEKGKELARLIRRIHELLDP